MSSDDQPAAGPPLTFGHVSRATTPPPRTHPRSRTSHTGSALLELPTMPQSIDPHLELLPTERPNLERFIATAYDFASVPLTDGPLLSPDIPPDALTGSRGPSDYDLNLSEEDTLNTVVYLSDLVSRFLPEIEPHLTRIKLNTAQLEHLEFIHRIFSYFRCKDNPSFIGSEKDTRRSFYNILGQPTQALLRAMLHSKVPKDDTPDLQKLHFVSAAHGDVITDEIWVYDRARVVNELKTPRVCSPGGVSIFNSIQSQNEKTFKFRWVVGSGRRLTNLTKVLMQLWSQLEFNNTQYGIVSDVETITFFFFTGNNGHYTSQRHMNFHPVVPWVVFLREFLLDATCRV
ncbi:hypothetical protein ABKN59_006518 [Abortiporus biennis]